MKRAISNFCVGLVQRRMNGGGCGCGSDSLSGGAKKSKNTMSTLTATFMILLGSLIGLLVSGYVVFLSYNHVMPKIYHNYSNKEFQPITLTDAMVLTLLTHFLIW